MINLQKSQDILTRLMAEEDIHIVRHNQASAFFDIVTRTIYKPNIDSEMIGNNPDAMMLIDAHEVSHALYTPTDHKITHILNVVEDARVDRKMKERYVGLSGIYSRGYYSLYQQDFFGIKNRTIEQVQQLGFVDRINLHFKLGFLLPVRFSEAEQVIVDRISKVDEFSEVLEIVEQIKQHLKDNKEQKKEEQQKQQPQKQTESSEENDSDDSENYSFDDSDEEDESTESEDESGEKSEEKSSEENSEDSEEKSTGSSEEKSSDETDSEEETDFSNEQAETISNFERLLENAVVNKEVQTAEIVPLSAEDKAKVNRMIEENIKKMLETTRNIQVLSVTNQEYRNILNTFTRLETKLEKDAKILSREFNIRKNASERRMDKISETGKINTKLLAKYQLTNKIFKDSIVRFEGKNHAFAFYLDLSGSMFSGGRHTASMIRTATNQILMMTKFCDYSNIPYVVIGYTTGTPDLYAKTSIIKNSEASIKIDSAAFQVLLRSDMPKKTKELARLNMHSIASHGNYYTSSEVGKFTPTLSSLIMTEHYVAEFFNRCNVEKRQIVFMTDGDPTDSNILSSTFQYHNSDNFITDSKTKKEYKLKNNEMWIVLNMIKTRMNANLTYMHMIREIKDVVDNRQYADIFQDIKENQFVTPVVLRSSTDCAWGIRRGIINPETFAIKPEGMSDKHIKKLAGNYLSMIKKITRTLSDTGSVSYKNEYVDNVVFIKMEKAEVNAVDLLEEEVKTSDKQLDTKKLAASLIDATAKRNTNRQLFTTLAECFA